MAVVRLDGPVKGRNTVCRDLLSDLSRIKSVGVSCIIWYVFCIVYAL